MAAFAWGYGFEFVSDDSKKVAGNDVSAPGVSVEDKQATSGSVPKNLEESKADYAKVSRTLVRKKEDLPAAQAPASGSENTAQNIELKGNVSKREERHTFPRNRVDQPYEAEVTKNVHGDPLDQPDIGENYGDADSFREGEEGKVEQVSKDRGEEEEAVTDEEWQRELEYNGRTPQL